MGMKRRGFLKAALAGSASLLPFKSVDGKSDTNPLSDDSLGVLVDIAVCIGCRKCEWACGQSNKLTDKSEIVYEDKSVFEKHRRPAAGEFTVVNRVENEANRSKPYFVKIQCMHCIRPACVSACLVGALTKSETGPVIYDPGKCMGCRYCMVSCPFQIPAYSYDNAFDPQVRKCSLCYDKITGGEIPACVKACPNESLVFGKRSDLLELAGERILQRPDRYVKHIYGQWEAGGTSWIYISGVEFDKTELPALESRPIPEFTENIQHGIFKAFIPPLVLFGILSLAMYTMKGNGKNGRHGNERA